MSGIPGLKVIIIPAPSKSNILLFSIKFATKILKFLVRIGEPARFQATVASYMTVIPSL